MLLLKDVPEKYCTVIDTQALKGSKQVHVSKALVPTCYVNHGDSFTRLLGRLNRWEHVKHVVNAPRTVDTILFLRFLRGESFTEGSSLLEVTLLGMGRGEEPGCSCWAFPPRVLLRFA